MYKQYAGQYQQKKGQEASARIYEAIVTLLQEQALPNATAERVKILVHRAGVSQQTLYKKHNMPLWHPRYTSFEMGLSECSS